MFVDHALSPLGEGSKLSLLARTHREFWIEIAEFLGEEFKHVEH